MTFMSHPHRMSSSELERGLYITGSPFHKEFFLRKEPFPESFFEEETEPDPLVKNNQYKLRQDFIASTAEYRLLTTDNLMLRQNEEALIKEIMHLQRELHFVDPAPSEKDIKNSLNLHSIKIRKK